MKTACKDRSVRVALFDQRVGLEMQLAPRTLVLSSGGDQLTIHTDFPFELAADVALIIGGVPIDSIKTWPDDCGDLVVRCTKDDVKAVLGKFDGRFTTINVTLVVNSEEDTKVLRVRK